MMSTTDEFSWQMELQLSARSHDKVLAGKVHLKLVDHIFLFEAPSSMESGNSSVASEG